ncbi:uracil-DNA glycosylase [Candidatus Pacearchaeota archaeon]|nr:uracil-DNA glycosylase [Candidatus Pacearchaeota archaeon]
MDVRIDSSWKAVLQGEFDKPYFEGLTNFVKQEYQTKNIFPPPKDIFKAFDLCPFDRVEVVVLGQDPYHGPNQAHGLCFSVNQGIPTPPSLVNIYKEIHADLGKPIPSHGNLEHWATQGVLLLNATLTVVAHNAGSHQKKGWEEFTDVVIQTISDKKEHVVFLLWGAFAQSKSVLIDQSKHLILKAPHPSPLSAHRGFLGCRHFSQTNEYLKSHGLSEVDW